MMKKFLFSLFVSASFLCATAQTKLQQQIDELAAADYLKHGSLGVAVIDVAEGKMIASINPHKSLIPASTLKAVTTATALNLLGATYRFPTFLQYDGVLQNGVLKGNLYLTGTGDPTFGSDQMEGIQGLESLKKQWVAAVQQAGIRKIEGSIVGDGTYFKENVIGKTWQWYDLGNYYAAGAWGLNLHENFYYLRFRQGQQGDTPAIAQIQPKVPDLYLLNEVRSAAPNTGDNAYIYGGPYSFYRVVRGTIPAGDGLFTIKGAVLNPPSFAAHQLLSALEAAGIQTERHATSQLELNQVLVKPKERRDIWKSNSPTLLEIAKRANHESVNLYCESLIRAIDKGQSQGSTLEAGMEKMQNFWESKGVQTAGWFLEDGSGLSPRNAITPTQMAHILTIVGNNKAWFNDFYSTLPIGGQSGTVKNLFRGTTAAGRIRAKSGSLERVRAYTGYVERIDGRLLAFAIMANDYTCSSSQIRRALEQLMIEMIED